MILSYSYLLAYLQLSCLNTRLSIVSTDGSLYFFFLIVIVDFSTGFLSGVYTDGVHLFMQYLLTYLSISPFAQFPSSHHLMEFASSRGIYIKISVLSFEFDLCRFITLLSVSSVFRHISEVSD